MKFVNQIVNVLIKIIIITITIIIIIIIITSTWTWWTRPGGFALSLRAFRASQPFSPPLPICATEGRALPRHGPHAAAVVLGRRRGGTVDPTAPSEGKEVGGSTTHMGNPSKAFSRSGSGVFRSVRVTAIHVSPAARHLCFLQMCLPFIEGTQQ